MDKLLMLAKLIPVVIEIIKAIEEAIPGEGKGEQKLVAVREILESTVEGVQAIWPNLEKVIKVLVKVFNTTGTFKK